MRDFDTGKAGCGTSVDVQLLATRVIAHLHSFHNLLTDKEKIMDVGAGVGGHETRWYIPWTAALSLVEELLPPEGIVHEREQIEHRVLSEHTPPVTSDDAGTTNEMCGWKEGEGIPCYYSIQQQRSGRQELYDLASGD